MLASSQRCPLLAVPCVCGPVWFACLQCVPRSALLQYQRPSLSQVLLPPAPLLLIPCTPCTNVPVIFHLLPPLQRKPQPKVCRCRQAMLGTRSPSTDSHRVVCSTAFHVIAGSIQGAKSAGGYRQRLYIVACRHKAFYASREGTASVGYAGDDLHFSFAFHVPPNAGGASNAPVFASELATWSGSNKRKLHRCATISCKVVDATNYRVGKVVCHDHYTAGQLSSADPSHSDVRADAGVYHDCAAHVWPRLTRL